MPPLEMEMSIDPETFARIIQWEKRYSRWFKTPEDTIDVLDRMSPADYLMSLLGTRYAELEQFVTARDKEAQSC